MKKREYARNWFQNIYKSSYPVIIFSEEELIDLVTSDYEMIEKDGSSVPENAYFLDENAESRFYVFQRKNHGEKK